MLQTKEVWKQVKLIARARNFEEFLKLPMNYDIVMSFLVIARKFTES